MVALVFSSVAEITEEVARRRREGGKWLKDLREKRGLSQKELAELVDVRFNTFISQLENGRGRIPPERYELWASALGIASHIFVERILFYYDPMTHKIIFGPGAADYASEVIAQRSEVGEDYVARIGDLHRLIGQKTAAIELLRSAGMER